MSEAAQGLAARVEEHFSSDGVTLEVHVGQVTAIVPAASVHSVCLTLRDDPAFDFAVLIDVCGIDYLDYGRSDWITSESATSSGFSRGVGEQSPQTEQKSERFAVIYHLLSVTKNERLRLRVMLESDPPRVESVVDVWNCANWFEREAFDLFGILFEGHPDLRRLLTDYGFVGHPFRKDFPLWGHVEMRYDPDKGRVVYEPVTIEPRTLVPRVIRHDEQYRDDEVSAAPSDED